MAVKVCHHVTLMSVKHKIPSLNVIIDYEYFSLSNVSIAQYLNICLSEITWKFGFPFKMS